MQSFRRPESGEYILFALPFMSDDHLPGRRTFALAPGRTGQLTTSQRGASCVSCGTFACLFFKTACVGVSWRQTTLFGATRSSVAQTISSGSAAPYVVWRTYNMPLNQA